MLVENRKSTLDAGAMLRCQTVDQLRAERGERDDRGTAVVLHARAHDVAAQLERRDDLGGVRLRRADALAQVAQLELAARLDELGEEGKARVAEALALEVGNEAAPDRGFRELQRLQRAMGEGIPRQKRHLARFCTAHRTESPQQWGSRTTNYGRVAFSSMQPPAIPGVRRAHVTAGGVRFHVTEAGAGEPVVLLHGWPQHHYAYRDLLADPPEGMRIIAPDLPGYGWSGPAPHRWAKEDVATDVLALLDALGLERVVLVGHDWGGYVGFLMVLRQPPRFRAYVPMNIAHPWQTPRTFLPHAWRSLTYMPPMAAFGVALMRRTPLVERVVLRAGVTLPIDSVAKRSYAERFRDPVCARAARDTYRTFLLRELPARARNAETRRASVPIRGLFGVDDFAVHHALASPTTAQADDYAMQYVENCGHFIAEERPDLLRLRLADLPR